MVKVFRPAVGCVQHPQAGQNTQQLLVQHLNVSGHRMSVIQIITVSNLSLLFRGESNVPRTWEIQRHLRHAKHPIRTVHPLGCRYPWWTSRHQHNFIPASSQSFSQAWLCSAHDQLPGIHWKWGQNTSIYSGQCCQGISSIFLGFMVWHQAKIMAVTSFCMQ